MTKAIKFNLIVDKNPVRDLDDLLNNFNLDDILEHYQSGLLTKWLEVRNLSEYARKILDLRGSLSIESAKKLCKILNKDISDESIEYAIYSLNYKINYKNTLAEMDQQKFKRKQIISNYHNSYEAIINSLLENKDNYSFIKSTINEIWANYKQIFYVDFKRFFNLFLKDAPLVVLSILANEKFREDDIFSEGIMEKAFEITPDGPIEFQKDTSGEFVNVTNLSSYVVSINNFSDMVEIQDSESTTYPNNAACGRRLNGLKIKTNSAKDWVRFTTYYNSFAGETDGYWKDIEPKGKKFMILRIDSGSLIRNGGKSGEEMTAIDVNKKFPILDGIDYKSNFPYHKLIYMEI